MEIQKKEKPDKVKELKRYIYGCTLVIMNILLIISFIYVLWSGILFNHHLIIFSFFAVILSVVVITALVFMTYNILNKLEEQIK